MAQQIQDITKLPQRTQSRIRVLKMLLLVALLAVLFVHAVPAQAVNGGGLPYPMPTLDRHSTTAQYEHAIRRAELFMFALQRRINQLEGNKFNQIFSTTKHLIQNAKAPPTDCIGRAKWAYKYAKSIAEAERDGEALAASYKSVEEARNAWQLFSDYRDKAEAEALLYHKHIFATPAKRQQQKRIKATSKTFAVKQRKVALQVRAVLIGVKRLTAEPTKCKTVTPPPSGCTPEGAFNRRCSVPPGRVVARIHVDMVLGVGASGSMTVTPPGKTITPTTIPQWLYLFADPGSKLTFQVTKGPNTSFDGWGTTPDSTNCAPASDGLTSFTCQTTITENLGPQFYVVDAIPYFVPCPAPGTHYVKPSAVRDCPGVSIN